MPEPGFIIRQFKTLNLNNYFGRTHRKYCVKTRTNVIQVYVQFFPNTIKLYDFKHNISLGLKKLGVWQLDQML